MKKEKNEIFKFTRYCSCSTHLKTLNLEKEKKNTKIIKANKIKTVT